MTRDEAKATDAAAAGKPAEESSGGGVVPGGRRGAMTRDKAEASAAAAAASKPAEESSVASVVPGYAKVMTDEQVEVLRNQISLYAALCEQLAGTHHALAAAHQGYTAAGVRLGGNLYHDPMAMVHGGCKFTARQRWAPTRMQLQILEGIFSEGNGALPVKQRITEITAQLSQHGQVAETNVYNWFQNRRARAKRNQKRKHEALVLDNA